MREWRGPLPAGTTQVLHVRTQSKQADGSIINKYSKNFLLIPEVTFLSDLLELPASIHIECYRLAFCMLVLVISSSVCFEHEQMKQFII